jgi:hypothetical protein
MSDGSKKELVAAAHKNSLQIKLTEMLSDSLPKYHR